MKFEEKLLKTCIIGLLLGTGLAILPYLGVGGPTPFGDGTAPMPSEVAASNSRKTWIDRLIPGRNNTVCMLVEAGGQNDSFSNLFIQQIKQKAPDWTVFSSLEEQPCEPNVLVNGVMKNVSFTRSSFADNTNYTTEGVIGAVALSVPGVSKSPMQISGTSDTSSGLVANLVEGTVNDLSKQGVPDGSDEDAAPAEDGITCVKIAAANDSARESIGSSLSYARPKWYIRDFNNAENCEPDYYFTYQLTSVKGAFGLAGHFTTLAVHTADGGRRFVTLGWAPDANRSTNAALNELLPHLK